MDEKAPALLEEEKSKSNLLRRVWDNATKHWQGVKKKLSFNLKDEYGIAIAYTDRCKYNNPEAFPTVFKQAMQDTIKSEADNKANFKFKAFHYYLTRALQELHWNCNQPYKQTVYRGVSDVEYRYTRSEPIRFGYFASSSLNKKVAEEFAEKESSSIFTVLTIHTRFGVDISKLSYNRSQEEVLIPVHEEFKVSQNDDFHSTEQNCSYFHCGKKNYKCFTNSGKKNNMCPINSATRGGIAFPSGMSPSLFGGSIILIHAAALKLTAGF
nr:ecto-ADP-ribosyltransferase 3-like isoform X2 [Pelodiscus sinensis]|eukprot:XP_025033710.1 ecto-ADP-ribosyltransferase 3-like isoform X2 [Pelodiscus sinensis]